MMCFYLQNVDKYKSLYNNIKIVFLSFIAFKLKHILSQIMTN